LEKAYPEARVVFGCLNPANSTAFPSAEILFHPAYILQRGAGKHKKPFLKGKFREKFFRTRRFQPNQGYDISIII